MLMKKVFSLGLALLISFGIVVQAAYIPQDVRETEFESDVNLMINLGLINYTDEGMFKPYSHLTRAEFAQLLDGILAKKSISNNDAFVDVDKTHFARDSINRLYEYGYINGDGDSYFKADDDITYNEAVRVMVSVLGYDSMAQYKGGYPTGYLTVASDIDITKGVSFDGNYINKGNIIRLLINCFDTNLVEVTFKKGKPVCSVNEEKTMLSEMTGIYWTENIVSANSDYSLDGKTTNDGYIRIGDTQMIAVEEYCNYVGYYVTCYYRKTADNEFEVVYLEKNEKKNEYIKADAKDIQSADDYKCTILNGNKSKSLKFDGDALFVYNNKVCKNFSPNKLLIKNGWLEFIDNNTDGRYDLVKINEYYNMIVEDVTEDNIYNKFDTDGTIDLNDADIRIYDDAGMKISIVDVSKDDVLSVFKSGDNKEEDIVKLIRSRKIQSGTVDDKNNADDGTYVIISGKEYKVYSGYKTSESDEIFLKDSGEFLLDAYDNVVSVRSFDAGVYRPAYLIQVKAYADDNTGEEIIRFKILGESGVSYLTAVEKIKVDGITYKTDEFENVSKSLQSALNQVVIYKINSKGNVNMFDTVEQNAVANRDDRLTAGVSVSSDKSLRYKSATKVFEGTIAIDDSTKVFLVPAEPQNAADSEFSFRDATYFLSDQSYKGMVTYKLEDKKIPVDFVILQASTSIINNESDIALIKKITQSINENDEEVAIIDVYANGTDKTFITNSINVTQKIKYITKYSRAGDNMVDFETTNPILGAGDLIKCSFDADGNVDCIALIYSAATGKMYSVNPYHTDFHEKGQRYVMGTVYKKYDEYVELSVNGSTECHNISAGEIFAVEKNKKEVLRKISSAEIKDTVNNKIGDKLIIITLAGTQKMTLLYK